MSDLIDIRVIDFATPKLARAFKGAVPLVVDVYANYLLGNPRRGLKHYAPYKYVSRKTAYGKPFFSARQRRYVMMLIKRGLITPGKENRTRKIAEGWKKSGAGNIRILRNSTRGAVYLYDDRRQARQLALVGHRKKSQIISDTKKGALANAKKALARHMVRMSGS